ERLRPAREERTADDVRWLLDLIERTGSLRYAQARAEALASAALRELESVLADLPGRAAAESLLDGLRDLTNRTT
ncbi:MAG: polyprenyl synthetase family protein, partial [Trueperaceae bacterium]